MKKQLRILAVLISAVLFGAVALPRPASATLIYEQHGLEKVVYDTNTAMYWVQDVNSFAGITPQQQKDIIQTKYADPAYFGIGNWHMATKSEVSTLFDYQAVTDMYAFTPYAQKQVGTLVTYWGGIYDQLEWVPDNNGYFYDGMGLGLVESLSSPSTVISSSWRDTWMYSVGASGSAAGSYGAWVVGTMKPAPVPEPCTALLVGLGLAAARYFGGMKRVRA